LAYREFDLNRNPLVEQPRSQPAPISAPRGETTLLDWLQASGRMMARADQEETEDLLDTEDPEISGLIDSDNVADFELIGDDEELDLED